MKALNCLGYAESAGVATVTLGPAISVPVIADLEAILAHLEDESTAEVVVFQGGEAGFCGEIDLQAFNPGKPLDIHGFHRWEKALTWLERLNKLTIAAVSGRCVGAGMQLVLVCDLRLGAEGARLGLDEVKHGFLPGMATYRLARYVGLGRAKFLTITGKLLSAQEACSLGILDEVVPEAELSQAVTRTIAAAQPVNLVAISLVRRLLNESFPTAQEDFVGNFLAAQHRAISSDRFQALLKKAHGQ